MSDASKPVGTPIDDRPKCVTCIHWYQDDYDPEVGECHQKPPEVFLDLNGTFVTTFPEMSAGNGCGQHSDFARYLQTLWKNHARRLAGLQKGD